jgi:hypothetical protein
MFAFRFHYSFLIEIFFFLFLCCTIAIFFNVKSQLAINHEITFITRQHTSNESIFKVHKISLLVLTFH